MIITIEKLEAKLETLMQQLEQSATNHNTLVGAKNNLEELIKEAKEELPDAIDKLPVKTGH